MVLYQILHNFGLFFEQILDSFLTNFVISFKTVKLNLGAISEPNNQKELHIPNLLEFIESCNEAGGMAPTQPRATPCAVWVLRAVVRGVCLTSTNSTGTGTGINQYRYPVPFPVL